MKVESNSTKKALDYLLSQKEGTYLSVIEQTTGLGKTHAVIQKIAEILQKSPDLELKPKIFVVTSGIETRNEFFHDLKEKLPEFESRILLFESVPDQVKHFLEELLSKTDYENDQTLANDYLSSWFDQNTATFKDTTVLLKRIAKQYIFVKQENDTFGELSSRLKRTIYYDLKRLAQKEEIKLNTKQKRLNYLIKKAPWICDLFKDTDLSRYYVLIMTADKFVFPYKTAIGNEDNYWDLTFKNSQTPILFLDESDKIKSNWTNKLIESEMGSKDVEDMPTLIRRFYANILPAIGRMERIIIDAKDPSGKTNKTRIKQLYQVIKKTYDQYHLQSPLKIDPALLGDNTNKFLFNTGKSSFLFGLKKDEKYLVWKFNSQRLVNEITIDQKFYETHPEFRLSKVTSSFTRLLHYIAKTTYSIARNYHEFKINLNKKITDPEKLHNVYELSEEHLQIVNVILQPTNAEGRLAKYFIDNYLDKALNLKLPNIKASFTDDQTIYASGFRLFDLTVSEDANNNGQLRVYQQKTTPEQILASVANKMRTILLSSTSLNPSPLGNFDLNWVKNNIVNFLEIPTKLQEVLDLENRKRNQLIKSKVKIDTRLTGKNLMISGQTFSQALATLLRDENHLEPTELQLERILNKYPARLIANRVSNGLDPDAPFLCEAERQDADSKISNTHFNFERKIRLLSAIINFLQLNQKNSTNNAFIIYTNAIIRIDELNWLKEAIEILNIPFPDDLFKVISSQNRQEIDDVKETWGKGKFQIMLTNKQALGRGTNLQYLLDKDYYQKHSHDFAIIDQRFVNLNEPFIDIAGIYIESLTHMFENPNNNGTQDLDVFKIRAGHIIYEQFELYDSNQTNLSFRDVRTRLQKYFGKISGNGMWDLLPAQDALAAELEQITGRLCRTNIKNKEMLIQYDYNFVNKIDWDYLSHKRTNVLIEDLIEQNKNRLSSNPKYQDRLATIKEKQELALINSGAVFLANRAYKLRSLSETMQYQWVEMREWIVKHPRISTLSKIPDHLRKTVEGFYYRLSKPDAKYYYYHDQEKDPDFKNVLLIDSEQGKAQQKLDYLKSQKQVPINAQLTSLNLEKYAKYLDKIFKQNSWIKQALLREKYDLDFSKKSQWLLTPAAFNNLYKAAISEEIFALICQKYHLDFHEMRELSQNEFERFDGFLKLNDQRILYVDMKNYDSRRTTVLAKDVEKHIQNKLNESTGNAAVIINFYEFEKENAYRNSGIRNEINEKKIYYYPHLFRHNGEIDNALLQDLLDKVVRNDTSKK